MTYTVSQSDPVQQGPGPFLFGLGPGPPPEAADDAAGEKDVLQGVQFGKKMKLLEYESNPARPNLGRFRWAQSLDRPSFQADGARVGPVEKAKKETAEKVKELVDLETQLTREKETNRATLEAKDAELRAVEEQEEAEKRELNKRFTKLGVLGCQFWQKRVFFVLVKTF